MYIRMTAKRIRLFTILLLLTVGVPLSGIERELRLGREDGWADLEYRLGVRLLEGYRGEFDLFLEDGEYRPDRDTDLLLAFNRTPFHDAAGRYRVTGAAQRVATPARLGDGAARFEPTDGGVLLEATPEAMFAPGQSWDDFTIEFWLYPAVLDDGETVLRWRGARRTDNGRLDQRFEVRLERRRLVWDLDNIFLTPEHAPYRVVLESDRTLLPRRWSHHMLRFEAETGLLEYLVDGVPRDVTHATEGGREAGDVYLPYLGRASNGRVELGARLSGLLDQLRFSRRYVTRPMLERTSGSPAVAITRPLDLGHPLAEVSTLDARYRTPGETDVFFFYRLLEDNERPALDTGWRRFDPGEPLPEGERGRYLQLRLELYPDGRRRESPSVSWVTARYEPAAPPAAPARVRAEPGDGSVHLRWDEVVDPSVEGYYLYYGTRPGEYFGSGAEQGRSPIDLGDRTEVELAGLQNGRVYYFAIAAYDAAGIVPETQFSREQHARPARRTE